MPCFLRGRYRARFARGDDDVRAAQRLRWLAFAGRGAERSSGTTLDADDHDDLCDHVLIEDVRTGMLVGCFRVLPLAEGSDIGRSYAAQYYDLSALQQFDRPLIELGRFCIHPEHPDPEILRVAWGVLTRIVDETAAEMLFGCSSFAGTAVDRYEDSFALLRERHLAPKRWLPRVKAPDVFRFARLRKCDPRRAMAAMPPLLRTYLSMGGWVSDHAVVDRHMNTLHVFTGLEIRGIPPARARLLRGIASGLTLISP